MIYREERLFLALQGWQPMCRRNGEYKNDWLLANSKKFQSIWPSYNVYEDRAKIELHVHSCDLEFPFNGKGSHRYFSRLWTDLPDEVLKDYLEILGL
jgi:hypothetical protein